VALVSKLRVRGSHENSHCFDSRDGSSQSAACDWAAGNALRDRIEGAGAEFRPLPAGADFDLGDIHSVAPELKDLPPGPAGLVHRARHDSRPADAAVPVRGRWQPRLSAQAEAAGAHRRSASALLPAHAPLKRIDRALAI
jgi:hypothetical protein